MNDKQTAIEALDALLPALLDVADGWPKEKCDKFQEIIITIRAALQSKTVDVDIDDIADTIKNNSPYGKSVIQQTIDHLYANGYLNTPQWQPIETAPRDGMEYVFYWHYYYPGDDAPTHGVTHGFWNKDKDYFEYDDEEVGPNVISHWAHMPRTEDTE